MFAGIVDYEGGGTASPPLGGGEAEDPSRTDSEARARRYVPISYSRSTSFRLVFRSVCALRQPMISAQAT